MAFTKDDLESINAAISSGELTVTVDGRMVTYRSVAELLRAKSHITQAIKRRNAAFAGFRVSVDRGIR
ncbi:MAG: phage head-tail joining protein [Aeromonas hydrophila]